MNRIVATMDDLPELPFLKVLSYLSLKDRLRVSAVSRSCHEKVANSRVRSLCYSSRSSDSILGKNRWVSGAFAQNFISSTRFTSFFTTFGQTILSSLKHLRLCGIDLSEEDRAAFARTLNSFAQLEQLDIISAQLNQQDVFNLNLPMLTSLQLEDVYGAQKLTLEAPRLRKVQVLECISYLRLEIVHGESVERLLVDRLASIDVEKLKNLLYLYVAQLPLAISRLLSSLPQLKEIHTGDSVNVSKLFEQKQQLGRADLKIYLCGLLLNGPHDPAINALSFSRYLSREEFVYLTENRSRLADEIPFCRSLPYDGIEDVAPDVEVDLLKRFTRLDEITVSGRARDIHRFLDLLKNCKSIFQLDFEDDQPQDLYDRLPEYFDVQRLFIIGPPSDWSFLFRLKHLIDLYTDCPIDSGTVRRAFEELPALSWVRYESDQGEEIRIQVDQVDHPKQFNISIGDKMKTVFDLNAAIEFIFG